MYAAEIVLAHLVEEITLCAMIAQLVEHVLAKHEVAGSTPVHRSYTI